MKYVAAPSPPLELIKQPPEKVHNAVQRLIMDAVWWVGKKGRDGWESGGEKVQVGYTLLTCGLRTPLNPCSEHFAVCTVCGAGLPFTESLKSQASRESGLPGLLFNFEKRILMPQPGKGRPAQFEQHWQILHSLSCLSIL